MKNYKQKLNKLYEKTNIKKSDDLSTVNNGYFPSEKQDAIQELSKYMDLFMQRYNIGTYLSPQKWGIRRVNVMQQLLYNIIKPKKTTPGEIQPPKSTLQVYNDLKDDVKGKEFTSYDFERVARTETARIKATFQLKRLQEDGVKYVVHKTKNDNKVSTPCKRLANRELEIDKLLKDEKMRIPIHINCRCRYISSMKGLE